MVHKLYLTKAVLKMNFNTDITICIDFSPKLEKREKNESDLCSLLDPPLFFNSPKSL